ncbi:MAG: UDP-N-acetylmuramate dehydrogenase [Paramuribaculum sp.]|nr:UDP-N-acetylmuramate dehydrogenase [Paramuribaculum sp.]
MRGNNTMRIDADCSLWIDFTSEEDLPVISQLIDGKPYIILGGGSNVLFTADYNGVVLHSSILDINVAFNNDKVYLKVGSGVNMDTLIEQCCKAGYWGLENLSGIPGEAGASAVQNIGAYGVEAKDIIYEVRCYDLLQNKFVTFNNAQCEFDYRWSMFKRDDTRYRYAITYVTFELSQKAEPKLEYSNLKEKVLSTTDGFSPMLVRQAILDMRNAKLPAVDEIGSAGSFFKNPVVPQDSYKRVCDISHKKWGIDCHVPNYLLPENKVKIPAAWLIEKVGLKGYVHGNAAVWHLQPLVLVNHTGKASADEILELEAIVKNRVFDEFGIILEAEVDHV